MSATAHATAKVHEVTRVVAGGYCVGCGGCTLGMESSPVRVRMNGAGQYEAAITSATPEHLAEADEVCPFSARAADEDEIAEAVFQAPGQQVDETFGRYLELAVGHVEEGGFRDRGSSGGFTSWILAELLERGLVDAVIHVKPHAPGGAQSELYRFGVSRTVEELSQGAKSHYYPVEMSGVLRTIRETNLRFAVVGVPCFIKAIRLLSRKEPVFRERVVFCIGLFCGHLKSRAFGELLAWQCGVPPQDLKSIDFRTKLTDRPASQYGITVAGMVGGRETVKTAAMSDLVGGDWGIGFFKYKACDYCDDLSAETADVSVGDAWLPEHVADSRGTNILVIRHPEIQRLFQDGIQSGRLKFGPIPMAKVAESQSANVRHRREGLAYRLHLDDLAGVWRPRKRVAPRPMPDRQRAQLLRQRVEFRELLPGWWSEARESGDLHDFLQKTDRLVRRYRQTQKPPVPVLRRLLRRLRRLMNRLSGGGDFSGPR